MFKMLCMYRVFYKSSMFFYIVFYI